MTKRTGLEKFHVLGQEVGFTLLDFWQWSASDLVSNATRGRVAEFIVAKALGICGEEIRGEWDPFDLQTANGRRVEVKSAAFVQSWFQPALSKIVFHVPKTLGWSPTTGAWDKEPKRQAEIYVFALLAHRDRATIDPLDLNQWVFFVLPAKVLKAKGQKSISLGSLEVLAGKGVPFVELAQAFAAVERDLPRA